MAYFFFKNGGLLVVVAKTVNTFHYLSIYLTFFFLSILPYFGHVRKHIGEYPMHCVGLMPK